jgi:hypothetical protein
MPYVIDGPRGERWLSTLTWVKGAMTINGQYSE